MFTNLLNRTPLVAFFLFIMVCLVVNHRTTYGQTPTPVSTPAATGVITGKVVDAVSFTDIVGATVSTDIGGYSTVTGADGSFVLEAAAGSYTLKVEATGYKTTSQSVTVVAGVATQVVFSLQTTTATTPTPISSPTPISTPAASGVIIGSVVDAVSFTGIAGATVSTNIGGYSTVTGADGSFVLEAAAGSYTLTVKATGYAPSSQSVAVEAGVATQVVFSLQTTTPGGGGVVFGFVNDENDDAFKGVGVTIESSGSSTVSGTSTVSYSKSTQTDDSGYYEFRDLAAGGYSIKYEKDGYQTQSQDISLVENEVKDLGTLTLAVVEKAKISGNVVNLKGDPIENVKLRLKGIKTGYNSITNSDADGLFEFNDLEADTYVLIAKKKGYKGAKQTISLGDGESQDIEIQLKKTNKRIIKASAR